MSFADNVDDAVKAIVSGEIENGHQVLLKEAYGGNAKAQHELGAYYECYENDFEEAFKWYKKAADQGLAGAQYSVGSAYDLGQGVEQNSEKAIKWYQLSVEQSAVQLSDMLPQWRWCPSGSTKGSPTDEKGC